MHIVNQIIKALGGQVELARKTGNPQQTVNYWATRKPPEIPPAHRLAVMLAAQADPNVTLPAEALEYLQSRTRTPKAPAQQGIAA
jgi:hypothetical protein